MAKQRSEDALGNLGIGFGPLEFRTYKVSVTLPTSNHLSRLTTVAHRSSVPWEGPLKVCADNGLPMLQKPREWAQFSSKIADPVLG